MSLPPKTATKAVADALGVNTQTVHNRIARIGKATGRKLSAEHSDADTLAEASREALGKAAETEAGKRERIAEAARRVATPDEAVRAAITALAQKHGLETVLRVVGELRLAKAA